MRDGGVKMTAVKRLMVVDDEADFCTFVREVAERDGFAVRIVTRSTEFVTAYEEFKPTIIVLDIVMPELDGIELVQWLASQGSPARIVLVTGYNPQYAETAEVLGTLKGLSEIRTLSKPVSAKVLREALA